MLPRRPLRRVVTLPLTLGLCAALATTACTEKEERATGKVVTELCDSSLSGEAVEKAKELGRGDGLQETARSSVTTTVVNLRKGEFVSLSRTTVCRVHPASEESGTPVFTVEFARTANEDAEENFKRKADAEEKIYTAGSYAIHSEEEGYIYFSCPSAFTEKASSTVIGYISFPLPEGDEDAKASGRGEAAMTVLHSVSRAVAEELGCLDEAGLPERLPEPSTTWTPGGNAAEAGE